MKASVNTALSVTTENGLCLMKARTASRNAGSSSHLLDEPWQRWFLAQLGTIRSPKTVAIVTATAKSSRVRELASRWLDEHRDYVHRHGG